MALVVFPVEWTAIDGDQFEIRMVGKTPDGTSACVHVDFYPYFYSDLPKHAAKDASAAKLYVTETCARLKGMHAFSCAVRRKSIWGFAETRERWFAQLAFPTLRAARQARKTLAPLKTYEASLDPVTRLFHIRNLPSAGWITVRGSVPEPTRTMATDLEVRVQFNGLSPCVDADTLGPPPLVLASWDIECFSESGRFPLSENPSDAVIQIATTFQKYGHAEPYLRTVVVLHGATPIEGVELVTCTTEGDLITAWADLLRREQTDLLVGYNTHQFDWRYVYGRALVDVDDLSGEPRADLTLLGRQLDSSGGQPKETELNSGAFGQNKFFSLATPGQLQLDLLQVMRRDHKLDSYSLNAVSAKFLGDAKLDLPAAEIFAKFRGSDDDRADIAKYAVKDTELPLRLIGRLAILENLFEMANAVSCPASYVYDRGQQVRVFSVIAKKARQLGFLCPDIPKKDDADEDKYEGATVLDACKGAYFDVVSGLDFASLYPSIIRAHNMCYSTLVMDCQPPPPGFEVYECNGSKFVQNVQSVLPELLADLAQFRKQAKADMAAAKQRGDNFAASVFNGKQLAYKVTMNSVYGFLGATRGYLPCLPIAMAVTATGRQMIADTKRLAETLNPGSKVIYGDTGELLLLLWLAAIQRPPNDQA